MAFRGQIGNFPVGLQGFNGSKNASKLGPGNFAFCEGVDVDGQVLVKDGGATKFNAVALAAKVTAGINWSPVPSSMNDVVVLANGQVRKDVGLGTFPTLLTTISAPAVYPPYFVRAGGEAVGSLRRLFLFTESTQVQVVSGTGNVMAAITTPPADWTAGTFPIFGVQHSQRLWGGGNASDPHRIYYSTPGNHQDFTSAGAGSLAIFPGEGDQLVAGFSFRGLLILVKYPLGVYVVDTRDPTLANWRVDKLNGAVGAGGPWCIVPISNDVVILDPFGNFHLMSAINDFSDINTSSISKPQNLGPFMRANVNLPGLKRAMGTWYASKSKAWFMVPQLGAPDNDLRIIIDFDDAQSGARFYLSRRDVGSALWLKPDATGIYRPTLGDDDGFVRIMDEEARNKDGAAYEMLFETAEFDFSNIDPQLASHTKNGAYLEITSDLVRNSTVVVTPAWDGNIGTPIIFSLGVVGAVLDSFVLDTDALSASGTVTTSRRLLGQGRRLKLTVENGDPDDEVRISEFAVGFEVADERLRTN